MYRYLEFICDFVHTFNPIPNPRQFGGFIAACGLLYFLIFFGANWLDAVLIVAGWSFGTLFVLHFKFSLVRVAPRAPTKPPRSSWSKVVVGGMCGACLTFIFIDTQLSLQQLFCATAIPTAIFYAFCKLGCLQHGCCGWPIRYQFEKLVPLQIIETMFSMVLAVVTYISLLLENPSITFFIFLIGHCLQRVASKLIRYQRHHLLLSPEVALIFLTIGINIGV